MAFPTHRPRRLRQDGRVRLMMRETWLAPQHLILPLFVSEEVTAPNPIRSMPGHCQWPVSQIDRPVKEAMEAGVVAFLLFGLPARKDPRGEAAHATDGVVQKALRRLRQECPGAYLITDVCLCAYTDHGHCGLLDETGRVLNDESLPVLAEMALSHVRAGADMVAPSDMMDGRIGSLRRRLDESGFSQTPIMAYSAKYASSLYGPFREAAHSAPQAGDRKGYQMDPANAREALHELRLDAEEGADVLMVKPGLAYLDIVAEARAAFSCPIAVYQVSGEYAMIKAAAEKGWLDERAVALETLLAMRRAGADWILTYFATAAARWLRETA
ncbi:MAG: porphobilinogen synthase [Candidatus Riflebacteria bacterium]|nr:porphobilinogen synthase [Candidatus Riflebacteria bacterium]